MITIKIDQVTKSCYNFVTPYKKPFFVYESNIRRAKKSFIKSFGLHGVKCIKFERVKK